MRVNLFRLILGTYTAIAALGHTSKANAELDGPPRKMSERFAVRQGAVELAAHATLEACEADARSRTSNPGAPIRSFQSRTGGGVAYATPATQEACIQRVIDRLTTNGATKTSGSEVNACWSTTKFSTAFQPPSCLAIYNYVVRYRAGTTTPPPTCPTPPAPTTETRSCPAGSTGSWTQTRTTVYGPPPACAPTVSLEPSAPTSQQCQTTPTCPTPPPPQTRPGACPSGTTSSWTQTGTTVFGAPPACAPTVTWAPSTPPAGGCVAVTPIPGNGELVVGWNHNGVNTTMYVVTYWRNPMDAREYRVTDVAARTARITGLAAGSYTYFIDARNCAPTVGCGISGPSARRTVAVR